MNYSELKIHIIDKCIESIKANIDNIHRLMEELQEQANDYGAPRDRYDGFRNQMMRQKDQYAKQMLNFNEELVLLEKIDKKKTYDTIEFGAAFMLDKQIIIVAAPLGKIEVDGLSIFAISAAVPIYKAVDGKRSGEKIKFNGNEQTIQIVF